MAGIARALGFFSLPESMSGKLAVVTGGNSGIGLEVVRALAKRGATVIMASRDAGRMAGAVAYIARDDPAAARNVLALQAPLDLLVNNAGRFLDAPFALTEDGFEQARGQGGQGGQGGGGGRRVSIARARTHAVNHWGHAYLTLLLLGRLVQAGPSRIVQVVSFGEIIGRVRLDDLRGARLGSSGLDAYCNSKLMGYIWLSELQARLRRSGARVDCFATQPGYVASRLMDKVSFIYPLAIPAYAAARLIALPPWLGCRSTLFAAADPSLTGKGLSSRRVGAPYVGAPYPLFWLPLLFHTASGPAWNPQAHDESLRVAVWRETHRILEEAIGPGVPNVTVALTTPDVGRAR
ncbi:short-chain dehydrogenase reductase [Raphidocelis subcapitata]|uniref:Short-chain dehydrogenase reductase n=1 Tax=Raphidocelis subcapitata TaxID=307507 RepID=A0A2V0NTC7_9CHLO|nr:short-chain dehydrogenase reductase [Raphidocelis subcapitata]|eukprot:GBF89922.1 short-chain dehydrogenase reductase [Raphidocelis subcapitata]